MLYRFAVLSLFLMAARRDLDVGVPPGSPLDFLRIPVGSPRAKPTSTPSGRDQVGQTTTADRLARPLMSLSSPLTVDFGGHLNWRPVNPNGTPSFDAKFPYPPPYPDFLYMHCVSFFLMVMLHGDQVSPREIVSYLIEIGEPAAYAATAVRGEPSLAEMSRQVFDAAGPVVGGWPAGPFADKIDKDIAQELVVAFPYEDRFGKNFLKLSGNVALPSLEKFAKLNHRFLARNAFFALRAYDEERVLPVLRAALKSPDKVIRNRALAALIRWQDTESVPWLIEQLGGADLAFRSYALYALGRIGDRRAVQPILDHVKRHPDDWEFLWAALAALARIRDGRPEVQDLLQRVGRELPRASMPARRRDILAERVHIAAGYLGDKTEQAWMPGGARQEANKALVREWVEIEREKEELARRPPPPPKPAPPPAPKPAAEPALPVPKERDPIEAMLAECREAIFQYSGVRAIEAEKGALRITVATDADAADLRLLLGNDLKGTWLVILVAP